MASDAKAPEIAFESFPEVAQLTLSKKDDSQTGKLRLAGVVQHQLARAEALFARGHERAAEDVTVGALVLLQASDAILPALRGHERALLAAAHAAARLGDSGRAAAFYTRALELTSSEGTKKDIRAHLDAIARFGSSTSEGELEQLGERARHTLSLSTIDPSEKAFGDAERAVIAWLRGAVQRISGGEGEPADEDRDEALETYRAIRTGAPALMALSIRHRQPERVVSTLKKADLSRALPENVDSLLVGASRRGSAEAWLSIFRLFDQARRREGEPQALPAYSADAAAFWAAIELYRAGGESFEHHVPLAMLLVEFGLPEVAARVLTRALTPDTSAEATAWAASLVMRGLLELGETEQIEAARLTFQEAGPLLARLGADGGPSRGAGAAYDVMASLEIRAGHPDRALALLRRAIENQAPADTWLRLAEVARQTGDLNLSLGALEEVSKLAAGRGDVLLEARAAEIVYDIETAQGRNDIAASALELALRRTLTAEAMHLAEIPRSATFRLLARILEHYGLARETRAAYEQALHASQSSSEELSLTLTDMARSALTTGDLRLARQATAGADRFRLPSHDVIYIALWQQLLERRLGEPSDHLPNRLLTDATGATGWVTHVRQFGLGQLDAAGLLGRAHSAPERAEARFYAALTDSDSQAQTLGLSEVARGPAIDLVEVRIAKDMLERREGPLPSFPSSVTLPDLSRREVF